MTVRRGFVAFSVFALFASGALADKLPKEAIELTADEVKAIYTGVSSDWKRSNAYFAPDGKYLSVAKSGNWHGEGKWDVKGNKVCADLVVRVPKENRSESVLNCWTWFKEGKTYWTLYSGEKDQKTSYYDTEIERLSKGDKVSKKFQKLAASN